ncbi:unnamed protein product, partial [Prorocentrum cordatum]
VPKLLKYCSVGATNLLDLMESEGKAEFAAPRAALAHMAKVALAQMVTQQKIK